MVALSFTLHFSSARRAGDCEADQTFEAKWPVNNAVPIDRTDERQRDIEGAIKTPMPPKERS